MAITTALALQLETVGGISNDLLGLGMQSNPFNWNRVETIELTERGYFYESEQTLVNIQLDQQKEKIRVLRGIKTFKLVPVEPEMTTADGSGLETVNGELPYKYEVMFDSNGMNFWKALRKLNSKNRFNVAFYDVEGNKIMAKSKSGDVKGFSTQLIFTGQYKGKEGNTASESKMTIQISDFKEMERATWIEADNLNFAPDELEDVNDVNITINPVAVGATSIVFFPLLLDKSTYVDGLLLANLRVKKAGVVVTPSAISLDSDAKTVTLTVPATTAATYTIETWNSTTNTRVIKNIASKLLYKSAIASVVCA